MEVQWHTGAGNTADRKADWRNFSGSGGGILLSHLTHVLDWVSWLGAGRVTAIDGEFGVRVPSRRGADGRPLAVDAEDYVVCSFSTGNGAVGTASVTNVQPGGDGLRIRVLGDRGCGDFSHVPPFRPCDQRLVVRGAEGVLEEATGEDEVGDTRGRAAARLLDLFVTAIGSAPSPELPTMNDAAVVLEAIERLRAQSERGDERVRTGGDRQ